MVHDRIGSSKEGVADAGAALIQVRVAVGCGEGIRMNGAVPLNDP